MENKIVCRCKKVTVNDLKDAIENESKTFEEIQKVTAVCTGCGVCLENNKVLVGQLLAKQKLIKGSK